MSNSTNKREPCKLNEKEQDTSSKIVVWCVRCPSRTAWQGHRRVAQHSPRFATQHHHTPPHHRDSYTSPTPAGKQASQAKPKHTQHKTTPQSRRHLSVHIPPCCFSDSPAAPWSNCSFIQQHFQTDAQTLKKMLLLSPSPSPLSCLGDVKTNKQEGTLQAK